MTATAIQHPDQSRIEFFRKGQVILWIMLAASMPLRWLALNSVITILWALFVVCEAIALKSIRRVDWIQFAILTSFFFLTVVSFTYSDNLSPVAAKTETRLSLAAIPLLFLLSRRPEEREANKIFIAFLVSCITVSLVCLVGTFYVNAQNGIPFSDSNAWYFSSDNLVEPFGFHPSYFSIYCCLSVFILYSLYRRGQIGLALLLSGMVYFILFIFLLASRVGILAFAAVSGATILYESWRLKRLFVGIILMVTLLAGLVLLVMSSFAAREKFYAMLEIDVHKYNEPFRINRRVEEWRAAAEVFRSQPIVGVGVGDMQDQLQVIYQRNGFVEGYENRYNPHNLAMDTAAAMGVIGILSLVLLVGNSIRTVIKRRDLLFGQFILLFLMISIVEATFSVQKGIAFFAFFNALMLFRKDDSGTSSAFRARQV